MPCKVKYGITFPIYLNHTMRKMEIQPFPQLKIIRHTVHLFLYKRECETGGTLDFWLGYEAAGLHLYRAKISSTGRLL